MEIDTDKLITFLRNENEVIAVYHGLDLNLVYEKFYLFKNNGGEYAIVGTADSKTISGSVTDSKESALKEWQTIENYAIEKGYKSDY